MNLVLGYENDLAVLVGFRTPPWKSFAGLSKTIKLAIKIEISICFTYMDIPLDISIWKINPFTAIN